MYIKPLTWMIKWLRRRIWKPFSSSGKENMPNQQNWTHIAIHHSLSEDGTVFNWRAIRNWHIDHNGWKDVGYHYGVELINNTYEVLVGRPLNETGAHIKEKNMNRKAIGICFVGNYDNSAPSTEMLDVASKRIIIPLMDIFNIDQNHIVFHRDYATYKSCPGKMFTRQLLLNSIIKLNSGLT